jgi:hypothetical protein
MARFILQPALAGGNNTQAVMLMASVTHEIGCFSFMPKACLPKAHIFVQYCILGSISTISSLFVIKHASATVLLFDVAAQMLASGCVVWSAGAKYPHLHVKTQIVDALVGCHGFAICRAPSLQCLRSQHFS